jgi:hypothetical protein
MLLDKLTSKMFIDEVFSVVKWNGIFGISHFRKELRYSVLKIAATLLEDCKKKTASTISTSSFHLNAICVSHAPHIFNTPSNPITEKLALENIIASETMGIPDIPPWDLISWETELFSGKTWIGASTIAAGLFGFRPAMNLALSFGQLLFATPKLGKLSFVIILGVGGAFLVHSICEDIEGMISRRYHRHIQDWMLKTKWSRENSRLMELACRDLLGHYSGMLISKFDEALQQQRRLRTQKDIEVRQISSVLNHFKSHRDAFQNLHNQIKNISC